ncbi:transposon Tf2-6 polyprotein [Trichonephila inaurata madagascariensis]|uniref:Transposon Tf2-6 polyprotein n=1 Tax=Trichonephila inaurata madagascariensis TaxID=2747483 RepID=A0A8X6JKL6_9ARAC|nr:transposon Tf2-6 polyprotein [Trichonephila inaurata madagascariensis]
MGSEVLWVANRKPGKREGLLNPISKDETLLHTYHVDFIGPLESTNKNYQHILTVIDAFTKFSWLYPVKTVSADSVLDKLRLQQKTFGNPKRIITDRGSAFTSKDFNDYCAEEEIQHLQIATGVPRGNGQVERVHRTLIPVLTKLSLDDPTKWYRHVDRLQRILNSTVSRSTK